MKFGINVYQTAARFGLLEGTEQPITIDGVLNAVEHIKELGYTHYEILTDPLLKTMDVDERRTLFANLATFNHEQEMSVSVHAPFWWIDISVPDPDVRKVSVDQIRSLIAETSVMNPTHHVIHALPRSVLSKISKTRLDAGHREQFIQAYRDTVVNSLKEICTEVGDPRIIAIENLQQEPDFTMLWEIAEQLDLSINYDYGHQFLADQDLFRGFDAMWSRIVSIHAHNVTIVKSGTGEICTLKDHWGLGTGVINTKEILEYLHTRDYQGTFVVEVMREDDALDSTNFLRTHGYL